MSRKVKLAVALAAVLAVTYFAVVRK